jgi:hypothetical protein
MHVNKSEYADEEAVEVKYTDLTVYMQVKEDENRGV